MNERVKSKATRPGKPVVPAEAAAPPPVSVELAPAETIPADAAPGAEARANAAKWTPEVWNSGWTGIPNALIEGKKRLGLTDAQFVVVVYLARRWYTKDAALFPGRETIGAATGKSVRAVQRALDSLVRDGFVTKKARRRPDTGNFTSTAYSLAPLVEQLKPIAADLKKAKAAREKQDARSNDDVRRRKARAQ